jgi:DNA sulfur modification protein DndD
LKNLVNTRSEKIPQEKDKEIIVQFPHGNELFANIERKGLCICGRPVTKGSIEERNLNALKSDAIKPSFNNRVAGLNLTISEINSLFEGFQEELEKRDVDIKADNEALKSVEERLEEIESEINALAGTDQKVKAIEENLNKINDAIDLNNSQIGSKGRELRDINSKISSLNIEIANASNNETKSEGLELFLDKIDQIKKYATNKLLNDEKISLRLIQIELNGLLDKYLYANAFAQINPETYEVKCYETGSKEKKILSTGEFELLKYLFIATILGLASKKTQAKLKYLTPPTSFPLIMDAPFTAMDTDFLQGAVDTISNKLEQVILLAIPKAFIEYEDLIKEKLGKKYLVVKADKLSRSESKEEPKKYKIYGQEQDFVIYDNNVSGKPVSQTIVRAI